MLSVLKLDVCLLQKKNRTENVKMLLKNNCINNAVTNGVNKHHQNANRFLDKTCKKSLKQKK